MAITHVFCEGVEVKGCKVDGNTVTTLAQGKAREFVDTTVEALESIRRTASGQQMFEEISASGHKVTIYRTKDLATGNYRAGGDGAKALVVALDSVYPNGDTELKRVLDHACEDLSNRSTLKKFFKIGKARPRFLNRDAIARLTGIPLAELKRMEAGKMAISEPHASKLKIYLYDFLTFGEGDSCHIGFNHKRENLSPEHKRYLPQSHTWQNRPPAIALAHELIHSWSFMVGQRPFTYGWEEEAMTVGLPPFTNMRRFSENKFRIEWGGLAIRPDYESGLEFKSQVIDPVAQKIGISADRKVWQGNQGALHANQALAQTASARRKAMGYDDDDNDNWDDDGF